MVNTLKQKLKQIIPLWLFKIIVSRIRKGNSTLSTKEVFTKIYREKKWGASSQSDFQSGSGSIDPVANAYANFINTFIIDHSIKSIVDLGCGDFNVGKRLKHEGVSYTGVDIVDDLIQYNNKHYGDSQTRFLALNIIDDELPIGELCLIRQVLQHLSNEQIQSILPKLKQYKYVLVSEHYPPNHKNPIPNIDKPHGEDVRAYDNSAVYLDKPPFNLVNTRVVFEIEAPPLISQGEKIKTILIDNA